MRVLHQGRMLWREVVRVVLYRAGLVLVCSVGVGRVQLCSVVREGMVRDGGAIRQRRVDDDGLVERVGRGRCMSCEVQRRGTGARERASFLKLC